MNPKHLFIDGSNYLFRSYFGVPQAANYKGMKVNAVYGFFAILRRIAKEVVPQTITVVFDSQTGIAQKIEERPEYKATRELPDTGMYVQLPFIKRILERCRIEWIEPPHHEADDVIGSLARVAAEHGGTAYVSSNDFDFAQLIAPRIILVRDIRGKAIFISEEDFKREWRMEPSQYVDYLSIKGDSSDNVAGISGIGPKTASDLVQQYGSIEGIVKNLENIPTRQRGMIQSQQKELLSNKKFLQIDTSIDVSIFNGSEQHLGFLAHELFEVTSNQHLETIDNENRSPV